MQLVDTYDAFHHPPVLFGPPVAGRGVQADGAVRFEFMDLKSGTVECC
jgi:hypothetical protein